MALTYGFYNSYAGDRKYDAMQVSELFDGLVSDGIIPNQGQLFAVTAGGGMTVNVGTGRAWFFHSWTKNDSTMVINIPVSDISRPRTDAVVLEINRDESVRANSILVITGTPSVNAIKPTLTNTDKIRQVPLAYVTVKAGVTEIKAENIENMVGRSPTVFAKGLLETASLDTLWSQWKGEFDEWFENIKLQLSGDTITNLQRQIDALDTKKVNVSDKASNSAAISGNSTTTWMTPASTKAAINANSSTLILADGTYTLRKSYGIMPSAASEMVAHGSVSAYDAGNFYVMSSSSSAGIYSHTFSKTTGAVKTVRDDSYYSTILTSLHAGGNSDYFIMQHSTTNRIALCTVNSSGNITALRQYSYSFSYGLFSHSFVPAMSARWVLLMDHKGGKYAVSLTSDSVVPVTVSSGSNGFYYAVGFVGDYFVQVTSISSSTVVLKYTNLSNGSTGTSNCSFNGLEYDSLYKESGVVLLGNDSVYGYLHGCYNTIYGSRSFTIRSYNTVSYSGTQGIDFSKFNINHDCTLYNYAGQCVAPRGDNNIYYITYNNGISAITQYNSEDTCVALSKNYALLVRKFSNVPGSGPVDASYKALNIRTGVGTLLIPVSPVFRGAEAFNIYPVMLSSYDYFGLLYVLYASDQYYAALSIYDLGHSDTPVVAVK